MLMTMASKLMPNIGRHAGRRACLRKACCGGRTANMPCRLTLVKLAAKPGSKLAMVSAGGVEHAVLEDFAELWSG